MGVDVDTGASQIAQLLQPEQPSDSEPEAVEQPEMVEEESAEVEEAEFQEEELETEDLEAETPEGDTEAEEVRYKVNPNGEEVEVTLDDLKKGYMMESDYRKKTSEVARHREENQAKEDQLTAKLQDAEAMLAFELEDLNSEENLDLKEYDRKAYEDKKEALEAKRGRLEKLKQDQFEAFSKRKADEIAKEKELLLSALPEWLDQSVLASEAEMVNKMWADMGFTDEQLSNFTDHRLVILSRKAALWDKAKAAKPEAKKVKQRPKSAKPAAATTTQDRANAKKQDARSKVRKTGNMRDAQAAIKSLLR
jgi:hypothetical protein